MADIVIINPKFGASFWGFEYALPVFDKRANMAVGALREKGRGEVNPLAGRKADGGSRSAVREPTGPPVEAGECPLGEP